MRELTIRVTGMHCVSCGLLIDDTILDIPGVSAAVTDLKSGLCRVQADDSVADADLLSAIAASGYEGTIA